MYVHIIEMRIYIYIHINITDKRIHKYLYKMIYICICTYIKLDIGMMVRVFANGPRDLGSIPGRVIPKIQRMVLDASKLNTQHYKVRSKGKVEQSKEWSSTLPYTLV